MDAEILLWTKIAAIGQALGAIATAAAVWLSLWVVLSERAARVMATAGLRLLVAGDGSPATEVISIEVTNIGQRPVRVSSIGWRTGWLSKLGPKWALRQYAFQTSSRRLDSHDPPYLLEPGEKRTMLIDLAPFQGEDRVRRNKELFARTIPFLGERPASICCSVSVIGARTAYFPVEKPLGKFLISGVSGAAERFNAASDER